MRFRHLSIILFLLLCTLPVQSFAVTTRGVTKREVIFVSKRKIASASVRRYVRDMRIRMREERSLLQNIGEKKEQSSSARAVFPSQVLESESVPTTRTIQKEDMSKPISDLDTIRKTILSLVNEERKKVGVPPLVFNSILQSTAQNYAEDMLKRDFFGHTDPDGHSSLDRMRSAGYIQAPCDCGWRYSTGENIAKGQKTASEVMKDWMASSGHRENILNPAYTELGVGFAKNYWVQHFGDVHEVK